MKFELCIWQFIEARYVAISEHDSEIDAADEMRREWTRREQDGKYTDVGTFQIREKVVA